MTNPTPTAPSGGEQTAGIYDVLYFGEDRKAYQSARVAAEELPGARVEDASDEIHGFRLSVRTSLSDSEWRDWLAEHGMEDNSLANVMDRMSERMKAREA